MRRFERIGGCDLHDCRYDGEWPTGSWWIYGDGDIWPSRPVLHRLYPEDEAKRKAKMEEARLQFQADRSPYPTEGDADA